MILRKPYAFLIKNFRLIHIILFAMAIYLIIKNISLYNFVLDYMKTGNYNPYLNSISNYTNFIFYLIDFAMIIFTGIIIYLLNHKKKPWILYLSITIEYIFLIIVFLYTNNYFYKLNDANIIVAKIRIVRDLLLIVNIPQYIIIILLLIRSIGLDLKKFGFTNDKEYLEIHEEDREEVEVNVEFDKDILTRLFQKTKRHIVYFYKENKVRINIILSVVIIGIAFYCTYYYIWLNPTYQENQTFKYDNYSFTVNDTTITAYSDNGKKIDAKKLYLITNITIKNNSSTRNFDFSKFIVMTKDKYYFPNKNANKYFLGYENIIDNSNVLLNAKQEKSITLIYPLDKEVIKQKYYLYLQATTNIGTVVYKKIKINPVSITSIIGKGTYSLNDTVTIEQLNGKFAINSFFLEASCNYKYEKCSNNDCQINQEKIEAKANQTILQINYNSDKLENSNFVDILTRYGKIEYSNNDGKKVQTGLINAINRTHQGSLGYFYIPEEAKYSDTLSLIITVRDSQYVISLKA